MFKNVLPATTALFASAKPCRKPVDFSWRLVRRKKRPFLLLPEKSGRASDSFELYSAHRPLAKLWRALVQRPDHYAFILHGVVHESFSDLIFDRAFLRNWLVIPPQQPRSERKAYLLDFFGKYLRGQPAPLLDRSDSPFGNVQPLRGNAAWTAAVDSVRVTEADRRLISPDKPIP